MEGYVAFKVARDVVKVEFSFLAIGPTADDREERGAMEGDHLHHTVFRYYVLLR